MASSNPQAQVADGRAQGRRMERAESDSELPWWLFPAMAYSATVFAVFGYNVIACVGFGSGLWWTFATLCWLIFFVPEMQGTVLLVFACSAGICFVLSKHRLFRERKELLLLSMPIASFLLGFAMAKYAEVRSVCSLGTWM